MAFQELYRAERLPVFQNRMFASHDGACTSPTGDMVLVRDAVTGLVFNSAFREELVRYDADYQNEQAVSRVFRDHLDEVTEVMRRHFRQQALIEVGCGKGYFLEHLHAQGFSVTGFDPTYEGSNPHIVKTYFEPANGLSADGIVLRHVLEHVQNPVAFLQSIRDANGRGGRVYIEVPCFDWIVDNRAWFDVFYEHVNYFRLADFQRMFGSVLEAGHVFGGQYLYVVADLDTLRQPRLECDDGFSFPAEFLSSVDRYVQAIRDSKMQRRQPVVVWGGASKGVIFALFMQRRGVEIDFVVDINPAKQGRFLAGTGYPVSSPQDVLERLPAEAIIFVMNGNYLPEIQEMTSNKFNYLTVDHENV